jgi:hypothetical protein
MYQPVDAAQVYLPLIDGQSLGSQSFSGPRVNAPYLGEVISERFAEMAVFWFGKVTASENYADVRLAYNSTALHLNVAVFDKRLWYDDSSPSPADFANWDSLSLFLNLDGNVGYAPGVNSHRIDLQLWWWEGPSSYTAVYRGNGVGWSQAATPVTTSTGWRGDAPNNNEDDRGWVAHFEIPFSSLGLSSPPSSGAVWGLGLELFDRDSQSGSPAPVHVWPTGFQGDQPVTWGQVRFGMPTYTPPNSTPGGTVTIRHLLNGSVVSDAAVGGTIDNLCPGDSNYIWNSWGNANFAGAPSFNIQNQADVADWPCFAKYYVTFPLNALPSEKVIRSATLTLHLWGNSGGGQWGPPPDSYIQVLVVSADWSESTLTWNNAPLALENIAATWVHPYSRPTIVWPGDPYDWDVSRAVAVAYQSNQPLRLVIYSADGPYHTGKYFASSDTGDWNAAGRPTLTVVWGNP